MAEVWKGEVYAPYGCNADAFCKTIPAAGKQGREKGPQQGRGRPGDRLAHRITAEEIAHLEQSDTSYGDFFRKAPAMNPNRTKITGKICGIRVEEIEDPLMREIRYLDKLVDELAKGKSMEQILRT